MNVIRKILEHVCRWLSGPDLDQKRFEELENKKIRGNECN
jgi:hypothetical protein